MQDYLNSIEMALKEKVETKELKTEVQNKGLVSPNDPSCPYVFLQSFASQGIGFGAHLMVDLDLLEKAIKEEDLISRGFVKHKED